MLLEQFNKIIYLFRVQIQLRSIGSHGGKALGSAGILHSRCQKVEENEVDVLHLVGAIFHKLAGDHAIWNMAAHAQPACMSSLHDCRNKFRLK